jgi:hypothetical protein
MDPVFANRGQIVQTVCAIGALVLALVVAWLDRHGGVAFDIVIFVLALLLAIALLNLWANWTHGGALAKTEQQAAPQIEIASVWQADRVAFEQAIYGIRSDPTLQVELRVFAGAVWHRQWPVEFLGQKWRGKCRFGDDPVKSAGQPFRLVAIAPKTLLADKIPELPGDAIKSEIITVIRSL